MFSYFQNVIKADSVRCRLFGTRNGNRTHNYPLGGGYYIHLTMQAYVRDLWFEISHIVYHKIIKRTRPFLILIRKKCFFKKRILCEAQKTVQNREVRRKVLNLKAIAKLA